MKAIKCLIFSVILLPLHVWSMTDNEQNHVVWDAIEEILLEQDNIDAVFVDYLRTDLDQDGIDDLVIFTGKNSPCEACQAYSVGRHMTPIEITSDQKHMLESKSKNPISSITMNWSLPSDDITLSQPPIFISDMKKAKNKFSGWWGEDAEVPSMHAGEEYNHMVFKPHVAEVAFTGNTRSFDLNNTDTVWYNCRDFKLNNPSQVAKMFRGYTDGNAVPVVVTQQFLSTHKPQQFSRWLSPEKKRSMNRDEQAIVLAHYGKNYRVMRSQWLATVPTVVGDRNYFQVMLVGNHKAMFSTVCLAEGGVASSLEFVEEFSDKPNDIEIFGADVDDLFSDHLPEISCVMFTDKGVELYVRWNSMEGTHYSVWREVGTRLVPVFDEYHYWFFN